MKSPGRILLLTLILLATVLPHAANPASGATVAKDTKKEVVYELPKTGVNQQRPDGGWINAEAAGTRLVVKFFDKKKKPEPPTADRGFALFKYAAKNPARAPLNRDGMTLATPAVLRPPHNFLLILSLFVGDSAEPAKSYTFRYP